MREEERRLEEKDEGRVQGETNGGLGVVDGFLICACAWMWVEGGRQEENIPRESARASVGHPDRTNGDAQQL